MAAGVNSDYVTVVFTSFADFSNKVNNDKATVITKIKDKYKFNVTDKDLKGFHIIQEVQFFDEEAKTFEVFCDIESFMELEIALVSSFGWVEFSEAINYYKTHLTIADFNELRNKLIMWVIINIVNSDVIKITALEQLSIHFDTNHIDKDIVYNAARKVKNCQDTIDEISTLLKEGLTDKLQAFERHAEYKELAEVYDAILSIVKIVVLKHKK